MAAQKEVQQQQQVVEDMEQQEQEQQGTVDLLRAKEAGDSKACSSLRSGCC